MSVDKKQILKMLHSSFPDADIELEDLKGDSGDHYSLCIKSKQFNAINKIKQHQLVYNALGSMVGKEIHALKIRTEESN